MDHGRSDRGGRPGLARSATDNKAIAQKAPPGHAKGVRNVSLEEKGTPERL